MISDITIHTNLIKKPIHGQPVDAELLESIRKHGVLVPLIISQDYEIVSGFRRYACVIALGLESVPVVIHNLTEAEIAEAQLMQ